MSTQKWPMAGVFLAIAMSVAGALPAQAEPLTPLTPAELQYLEKLRAVLTASHDNEAFRSDGELLAAGRYVCVEHGRKFVGQESTLEPAAVTQLAFIYLCPS